MTDYNPCETELCDLPYKQRWWSATKEAPCGRKYHSFYQCSDTRDCPYYLAHHRGEVGS